MSDNFKTVTLDNGNTFAYYPTDSEVTILPNGDYFAVQIIVYALSVQVTAI